MATVTYTPDAAKQLRELPTTIQIRIAQVIVRLQEWPEVSGVKPLRHELAGHYRIRTGDYRVQFHIVGESVIVERIGHRDGFYED